MSTVVPVDVKGLVLQNIQLAQFFRIFSKTHGLQYFFKLGDRSIDSAEPQVRDALCCCRLPSPVAVRFALYT
jgi:hypothetical protein